jgi:DNA-directed RNA polymerase subunit RPC12/RpoP
MSEDPHLCSRCGEPIDSLQAQKFNRKCPHCVRDLLSSPVSNSLSQKKTVHSCYYCSTPTSFKCQDCGKYICSKHVIASRLRPEWKDPPIICPDCQATRYNNVLPLRICVGCLCFITFLYFIITAMG